MEIKKPFIKWVFCETDGTPSFARVATAVVLAFMLGWITSIVLRTNAFPELGGAALFITAIYGANKFATQIKKDE